MLSVSNLWTNILLKEFVPYMFGEGGRMNLKSQVKSEPGQFDKKMKHNDGQSSQWNDKEMRRPGNSVMPKVMPRMPRRITNCNGCG
eukprot:6997580-Karenia_brevis.AAC.1